MLLLKNVKHETLVKNALYVLSRLKIHHKVILNKEICSRFFLGNCISLKGWKYFWYNFRGSNNIGKLYFFSKITKKCIMCQIILSFLTVVYLQNKMSEYLDYQFPPETINTFLQKWHLPFFDKTQDYFLGYSKMRYYSNLMW